MQIRKLQGFIQTEGYALAAKRMFYPIVASTGTTLAAFIPIMFWPGFTGQFMRYLPITIFFVLSASLFYSLIVIPVLGSYFGQKESALNNSEEQTSVFVRLTEWYGKYIKRFVENPVETFLAVVSVLLIIMSYAFLEKALYILQLLILSKQILLLKLVETFFCPRNKRNY